jgi:hypothetical protein
MSYAFARRILDRARSGHPYSAQTITRCLRITGDIA